MKTQTLVVALVLFFSFALTFVQRVKASEQQLKDYFITTSPHPPYPPPHPPPVPPGTTAPVTCKPRKPSVKPYKFNWVTTAGGSSNESVSSVATDSKSNSVTVGWTLSKTFQVDGETTVDINSGTNTAYMIKLTPAGKFIWSVFMNSTGDAAFYSVTIDNRKNSDDAIYVVGAFTGNATIGNKTWISNGGYDALVLKFNSSGYLLWSKQYGGYGDDVANDIAIGHKFGDLYIVGSFTGAVRFNTRNTLRAPHTDAFVLRLKKRLVHLYGYSVLVPEPMLKVLQ